jgi:hypothetical protein
MRSHEFTHPYIAQIEIDPADFAKFERFTQGAREVHLIRCDDSKPDLWTLHVGCASEKVRQKLEEGWA